MKTQIILNQDEYDEYKSLKEQSNILIEEYKNNNDIRAIGFFLFGMIVGVLFFIAVISLSS